MIEFLNITGWLVGFITFTVFLSYGKLLWRRSKMPPGPFPLPVLGNFLQIHSEGLLPALLKMSQKYGPVYTVHFGSRPTVVVTGYEALKEVLIDDTDAFINRGSLPAFDLIFKCDGKPCATNQFIEGLLPENCTHVNKPGTPKKLELQVLPPCSIIKGAVSRIFLGDLYLNGTLNVGLTFMNGEMWKQLRQFSFWTLRDLGMGKKSLEEPILDEAHHFVEHFKGLNGKPVDPKYILVCAISNILANLLMGIRYEYEDKNWMNVLQLSNEGYHILSSVWGQLYDIFPAIFHYLPGPHRKMYDLVKPLSNIFTESVKTHLDTLDPACPRDYMDCFLVKMKQEEKNNSKTPFTPRHLAMSTYSMFLGGTESAAGTTYFGLLFLIKYPELQGRLHEEIDQVIGQTREPKAEDRNLMPFMNAFVHEIQRFSDIFPMGFMRATTRDTKLRGFFIFKDTNVMPMLTTALRDPTMFETPEEFNVNHFLDENGKFKKNNAFIPFSAGKRVCIAEGLVRMQLFLFFTIILQNFTLKSEVDPKNLDVSPKESGFENLPPACKIIFTPNKLEGRV